MATPEEVEVRRKLVDALGEEAVASEEAANELRRFSVTTKSIAARQKKWGDDLINTGIPLIKFTGTLVKTLSSYNANIKIADQQQQTNQQKLNALEAKRQIQLDKLNAATTEQEKRKAALKLQATLNSIEATKLDTEQQKENVRALKSARIGEVVQQTAKSMKETGQAFTKLTTSLNKTQQDFGIGIGGAAALKGGALLDTAKDSLDILTNADWGAIGSGIMDIFGGFGAATFGGRGFSGMKDTLNKLNQPIPGKAPNQLLLSSERLAGMKSLQQQFGVINKAMGESLAQTAKNYGVSVDELVKAKRVFVTITRGDLSQVDTLQNKFFARFKQAGMERNVALQTIVQYAELIARNGTRFADSFARAAADAKRIGVDLSKVEQFGDNIIDNFEGFLESQAELGAMGFGFDTSRLAEIAITGDTGALYEELRSQLAMTGKDINKLNRAERLSLEGMGIDITEMQRMAGGTPEISPEDLAKDSNSKLLQILTVMQAGGGVLELLGHIAGSLASPTGLAILTIGGILTWLKYRFDREKAVAEETAKGLFGQNKAYEARDALRQAGFDKTQIEKFTQEWLTANDSAIQTQIKEGKIKGATYSKEANKYVFTPTDMNVANERLVDALQAAARRAAPERADGGVVINIFDDPSVKRRLENRENINPKPSQAEIAEETIKYLKNTYGNMYPTSYRGNLFQPIQPSTQSPQIKPQKKAAGGIISGPGTGTSDSIPARLSDGEYVVKASAVKRPGVKELLDKINYGNESVLMKAQGGFINKLMSRIPDTKNLYSTYKESGIRGFGSQLFGQFGNRIPGLSSAMDIFSAFKQGGVKGTLGSLARGGIGKMIGGAIGSAIPIPGVGTAIGSLMGSKVGKLVGGLFGRRKKPVGEQLMGALPDMAGFAGNLMGRIPGMERFNPEGLMRGMAERPQAQAAVQTVVDTTGIEQKLNNFVNALNNMNIVMDGAKVGKVLVNVTDAANTVGVFRPATRATL